ncbi:MAG: glycoside hydrolase family 2, candidate beta-glycosidase [Herbinix sp.]|jgi:beta-galactosidase/beta-glucuronidase|nr:glycoside hydrolase family 2, candidate beta-glycosidase [Herbinix sp.]
MIRKKKLFLMIGGISLILVILPAVIFYQKLDGGTEETMEYRNIAMYRAAYHSGSSNYNETGHLVTDGIIMQSKEAKNKFSNQHNDSPANEDSSFAFDGQAGTKWLTFQDTAWLQVEYPVGEAVKATAYEITSANDADMRDPLDWIVQGSEDGKTYEDLDSQTGQKFEERFMTKQYTLNNQKTYRYYRLLIINNNGDICTQLAEWNLMDENDKSLIAANTQEFISAWSSEQTGEQYVYIDLGAVSSIDKVQIYWLNENYATNYDIQVADDAQNWTTVYNQTNGNGQIEECVFTSCEASYVRLLCKEGPADRYSVSEIQIYGSNDKDYKTEKMAAPLKDGTQYLSGGNWRLRRASEVKETGIELSLGKGDYSTWLPAVVPGTVLTSYLRAGAIPDPNIGNQQLQISDSYFTTDFWYTNHFEIPKAKEGNKTWLNFDAINWKADVYFNGVLLGTINGAFTRGKFDVSEYAKYGEMNDLAVYIHKNDNPGAVSVQTMEDAGPNGGILGMDNPTIHASIGWDWVPTVRGRNIGIYGDVYLNYTEEAIITDPWIITELDVQNKDFSKAALTVKTGIRNTKNEPVNVVVQGVITPGDITFTSEAIELKPGEERDVTVAALTMNNPILWWPNTYGDQFLYTAKLEVLNDSRISDTKEFQFGVRQFTYKTTNPMTIFCNGTRIVCRGGNWGMDDSNLAATEKDYDIKVRLHAEDNFTMIRNWVGMTNHKAFYDACDKYGILIWDDFWLANPGDGPNPENEAMFIDNAQDKIKRNRYHAALALYCGRNEGDPPQPINNALTEYTADLDGTRHYIPHSAAGTVSGFGPYTVQGPTWYFQNTPVTLHSERGMPNIPTYESMLKMLTEQYAWPINEVWGLHDFCGNSAQNGNKFQEMMQTSYGTYDSLLDFVRIAQMVNYENHKAMFEAVYTSRGNGLLMWMSQSAWPSMVWQTYDYYYDTNAGYFAIKKANQPINAIWNSASDSIILSNGTAQDRKYLKTVLNIYDLNGKLAYSNYEMNDISADTSTVVMTYPKVQTETDLCFIELKVQDIDNHTLADNFYWTNRKNTQDYTSLNSLAQVLLNCAYKVVSKDDERSIYDITVKNVTDTPALLIHLKTLKADTKERILPVYYEDNYFSLMPGKSKTIRLEIDSELLGDDEPFFSMDGWNVVNADIPASEND